MKSSPGKSEFFKSDDVNVGSDQGASKVVISFGETDQSTSILSSQVELTISSKQIKRNHFNFW